MPSEPAVDRPDAALDALLRRSPVVRSRGRDPAHGAGVPVRIAVAAVAVAAVVGWLGWHWLARPAPIDERMPVAAATGQGSASAAPSSPGSSPPESTSAGDGSSPGSSSDPAGPGSLPDGATAPVTVHVAGAVNAPGVVTLAAGSRVVDAVQAAGGLGADADADRLNLAAPLVDGSRIAVPRRGEDLPAEVPTSAPAPSGTRPGSPGSATGAPGAAAGTPLDLNTATAEQLDTLPGVGPSTAAAILARRDEVGSFHSVDDLLEVRGIGPAKLDAIRDFVTVR